MAYIYADLAAIRKYHDSRVLAQLTVDDDDIDPDDPGVIDEDVLEAFENDAAHTIDNHLREVYGDLPLTGESLTTEIIKIAANLTWCGLWERRGEEPEQVTHMRERCLDRLKAMSEADAKEVRGARQTRTMPGRSTRGKARTIFDSSGYFDGLRFPGKRDLIGDDENKSND
jgi:hypothetical protein